MTALSGKSLRISFLAVVFGGVALVLGKTLLFPHVPKEPTPLAFPESVPLPNWQFLESSAVKTTDEKNVLSGWRYEYQQNNIPLEVEMQYIINTHGDVEVYLRRYSETPVTGQLALRQLEGVGFYNTLVSEGKAYLSTCINPRGGTTVSKDQFRENRNLYDVQLNRFLPWLLGQQDLRDWRCLWTTLSMPVNPTTPEDTYKTLETAWVSWYEWWQPQFPQP